MASADFMVALTVASISVCFAIVYLRSVYRKSRLASSSGKCVFISGCDSGIGQKLVIHLLGLGFEVFAGCLDMESESSAPLRDLVSEKLHLVSLDITSDESVRSAMRHVQAKLNSKNLWGLINNAGICVYGEFEWLTMEQSNKLVQVNLLGTLRLTKMFLPLIRQAKGRIVTITSVNGDIVYPGLSVYCATKYALEAMSDALRYELKKFGVFVSVIRPGDFARLTNIMRNHSIHVEEMWNHLNNEQKSVYGDYFRNYHETVLKNYGITSYKTMESSPLLNDVCHALLSGRPKTRYICAPWSFRIFFAILKLCPAFLSDELISILFSRVFKK